MALRVLLADESPTIKKVMQLSLQDFAVEVKSVAVGLDVQQVALAFKPDIIFADVLLVKKNGYDVAADLKADPQLKHIPIVLMWSGFMNLDEAKAKNSKADRKLEKPFDAETLRALVKELVPATQDNVIANYLSFPDLPPMVEEAKPAQQQTLQQPTPAASSSTQESPFEFLKEIEEPEQFQQVPLPKPDLSSFKLNIPQSEDEQFVEIDLSAKDMMNSSVAMSPTAAHQGGLEEVALEDLEKTLTSTASPKTSFAVTPERAEELIRQEVRTVIESVAWKIIPDITERIVREELEKLLKDAGRI